MHIRDYTSADREACMNIFKSNMPLFFDPGELHYLHNWLNAKDLGQTAYPGNQAECFYVLETGGQVLACGGFYIPLAEAKAHMVWGMVNNADHKHGYGKKLLEYRIGIIKASYPSFSILLDTSQHTFKFFERLGFSVTKITNNAYGPGLHRYDMLLDHG